MDSPASITQLGALALSQKPKLGSTLLIAIDGPAGSGKTTLSARLAASIGAHLFHVDQMLEGWGPIGRLWPRLESEVLKPLRRGAEGAYESWDWDNDCLSGEILTVPVTDILIIEGVGSAHRGIEQYASLIVWIEAPQDERLRRGLERPDQQDRSKWDSWMPMEQSYYLDDDTASRAHVVLDGTAPFPD